MADDDPDMEVGPTCTAEELAAQRYETAKANGDVLELSSDDEDEPPAKPQTPRRSRLDDVTFGADGRARDTHTQRKRRQIVISDDDESEFDEFDEFDEEKDDVKREYVRMLRAAREDIKERGQWDPIDEAIKAAQARVNLDDRRDDDRLRRIRGAMCLKVRTSELASRVGTCVEIERGT